MKLVELLASGVRGAEDGHVEFYQRGSTTRATWYLDFEAGTASNGDLTLDANGGGVAYVDGLTTVKIYKSDGVLLRTVVAGANAGSTETKGQSFTGTDYGKTLSAADKPVTLQTVLDRWLTSAGTTDWNVIVSGADKTLQAAIGAVSGIVYNVKSSEYGAAGDGATDDASAIQAAIDAANTDGGGIVFVPPGDYKIGTALSLPSIVSFIGSGAHRCSIRIDHATSGIIDLAASGTAVDTVVSGISFGADQPNNGDVIDVSSTSLSPGRVLIERCWFGVTADGGDDLSGTYVDLTAGPPSTLISIRDCEFVMSSAGQVAVWNNGGPYPVDIDNCHVTSNIVGYGGTVFLGNWLNVSRCWFDTSNVTSSHTGIRLEKGFVIGNRWEDPSSGTLTCIDIPGNAAATGDIITEFGNIFGTDYSLTLPYGTGSTTRYDSFLTGSRLTNWLEITDNNATLTLPGRQFSSFKLNRTASGAQTINTESPAQTHLGAYMSLLISNTSGSAITFTWGSEFDTAASTELVNNGDQVVAEFKWNGTQWVELAINNYT